MLFSSKLATNAANDMYRMALAIKEQTSDRGEK